MLPQMDHVLESYTFCMQCFPRWYHPVHFAILLPLASAPHVPLHGHHALPIRQVVFLPTADAERWGSLGKWTEELLQRWGFVGVLVLSSWPNPAFDVCGLW